ncbi:hypothetical protein [Flavobacterium sp. I3-2]|uniref:hypothetical protein n=1 Tax=Flavobacterium sp. I3-2 TaxID=2748319 RepID=UPI003977A1F8
MTKSRSSRCSFFEKYKKQMSDCVLLGDSGYLSQSIQLDLFSNCKYQIRNTKKS